MDSLNDDLRKLVEDLNARPRYSELVFFAVVAFLLQVALIVAMFI